MKKQFLVTISNDTESLSGVQFLCSFFQKISRHQATLLHICRLDSSEMAKALTEMWLPPGDQITDEMTLGARRAIAKAQEILSTSSMSVENVITKTVAERYGKVADILNEGSKGLYDAIILGKRASYTLQWVFERPADETAQTLIKSSSFTSPVWICPKPDYSRKNVLVCVDGSEPSERAVDHVGYMLGRQEQHLVTLFHVNLAGLTQTDELFSRARKILNSHNIRDDRINTSNRWGFNVAGPILSKIEHGGYAAVAMGLRGLDKHGLLKDYNLAGGTTSKIISKLEKDLALVLSLRSRVRERSELVDNQEVFSTWT